MIQMKFGSRQRIKNYSKMKSLILFLLILLTSYAYTNISPSFDGISETTGGRIPSLVSYKFNGSSQAIGIVPNLEQISIGAWVLADLRVTGKSAQKEDRGYCVFSIDKYQTLCIKDSKWYADSVNLDGVKVSEWSFVSVVYSKSIYLIIIFFKSHF